MPWWGGGSASSWTPLPLLPRKKYQSIATFLDWVRGRFGSPLIFAKTTEGVRSVRWTAYCIVVVFCWSTVGIVKKLLCSVRLPFSGPLTRTNRLCLEFVLPVPVGPGCRLPPCPVWVIWKAKRKTKELNPAPCLTSWGNWSLFHLYPSFQRLLMFVYCVMSSVFKEKQPGKNWATSHWLEQEVFPKQYLFVKPLLRCNS